MIFAFHFSFFEIFSSFYDAILFILNRLFGVVRWPIWIIITIRHLMGGTIDAVTAVLFRRFLNKIFVEVNCIRILRFIQESIVGLNNPVESDQVLMIYYISELHEFRVFFAFLIIQIICVWIFELSVYYSCSLFGKL